MLWFKPFKTFKSFKPSRHVGVEDSKLVVKGSERLPATVGISFLAGAGFYGSYLRADSHWLSAVAVLALWGLATALFFTSNHTAMITSVPDQHRGVATGAIYVMFGLGTTIGISLGNVPPL